VALHFFIVVAANVNLNWLINAVTDLMTFPKKFKFDARPFQESWTADVEFVSRYDRAICVLNGGNIFFWTSSTKTMWNETQDILQTCL